MRRWFLILLVALLPLRGWAVEAMAGQMAAQQLVAIKNIAASPHHIGAGAGFSSESAAPAMPDCHGQAGDPAPATDTPAAGTCASCSHCQACSTVALQADPVLLPGLAAPHVRPALNAERFASAPRAPAIKPPIS